MRRSPPEGVIRHIADSSQIGRVPVYMVKMVKKIFSAASWLSLVQVMNMLSVIILSIYVIRRTDAAQVSSYMYAVFITDAVMSYTLLQIAQRITLAQDDTSFKKLFAYSRVFGLANAVVAVVVVGAVVLFSDGASHAQSLTFIAWLTAAGLANYFAQLCFSVCDYTFEYRSFGLSSALSNVVSLVLAVAVFMAGGGIFSMVLRDVARAFILLVLGLRSVRKMVPQLREVAPLDRRARFDFFRFLIKRHTLKVFEVSNHRVPALLLSSGNMIGFGQFGVAFQLLSQIMNVLTIVGDKVAYSFFSRGAREQKLKYLMAVMVIYAVGGGVVFLLGEQLFSLIYGQKWLASAKTFSYLGLYMFTHGTLVVVTNFLITEQRFAGVYLAWAGWTTTFAIFYLIDRSLPIVSYYLLASAASAVLVVFTLLLSQYRSRPSALQGTA